MLATSFLSVLPLAQGGNFLNGLLPMVAIMVIFYFLLIRPQQKERKQQEAMRAALSKGDRVLTQGGVVAKIASLDDEHIVLHMVEGKMKVMRGAIVSKLDEKSEDGKAS